MDWNTITSWLWALGIGALTFWMLRRGSCAGHSYAAHAGPGTSEHQVHMTGSTEEASDSRGVVRDPVCGMELEVERAAGRRTLDGRTLYFCSRKCLDQFDEDPKRFAGQAEPSRSGHHGHGGCC
jgi:YHS domain-containing protein